MSVKYQPLPTNDLHESKIDFSSPFQYSSITSDKNFRSIYSYTDQSSVNHQLTYEHVSFWRRFSHWAVIFATYLLLFLTLPISLWFTFKKVPNYERLVIFRLGMMLKTKGPGYVFYLPCIDQCHSVDMRTKAFNVPPQQILIADGAAIEVGADVYIRIVNVEKSVACIQDHNHSVRLLVQLTLVKMISKKTLEEIEQQRQSISDAVQAECNITTSGWGIEISRCELSHIKVLVAPSENKLPLPKCIQPPCYTQPESEGKWNLLPPALQPLAKVMFDKQNERKQYDVASPSTPKPPMGPNNNVPAPEKTDQKEDPQIKHRFDAFMSKLRSVLDEDLVKSVQAVFMFNIIKEINRMFLLDLRNGSGSIRILEKSEKPDYADVIMTIEFGHLISMIQGELNPVTAYKKGFMEVTGKKMDALKINIVLKRLQAL
ncbi:stomatin-like protein 1 [Argonauta hians]